LMLVALARAPVQVWRILTLLPSTPAALQIDTGGVVG
jgi:hypothetical protein